MEPMKQKILKKNSKKSTKPFKQHSFKQMEKTLNHNFLAGFPEIDLEKDLDTLKSQRHTNFEMKHPYVLKHFQKTEGTDDDTKRRKDSKARTYNRLLTGLQIARYQNLFGRFLTLTSSYQSIRPIKKSFDILKNRIERATWKKDGFHGFKFNRYYSLRTKEGKPYQKDHSLGVLHIIYWGQFIPIEWLRTQWFDIHQAFEVKIKACKTERRKVNGLVNYLLTNYLSKQPIVRMSYGWKWAWLGFCKSWLKFKEVYKLMRTTPKKYARLGVIGFSRWKKLGIKTADHYSNKLYSAWDKLLHNPPPSTRQIKLKNNLSKPMLEVWKTIKTKALAKTQREKDYHYEQIMQYENGSIEPYLSIYKQTKIWSF